MGKNNEMTPDAVKQIIENIEKNSGLTEIHEKLNVISVSIGKIEEHLKGINGSVNRHETDIGSLFKQNLKQSISIAKIWGIGIGAGGFSGIITSIIVFLISRGIFG